MRIAARVHRALTVTQNTKSGGISHGCLQYDAEHHSSMGKQAPPKLERETESHRIERWRLLSTMPFLFEPLGDKEDILRQTNQYPSMIGL